MRKRLKSRRYLLIPGNNSLSHVAKCLAVSESLAKRGHTVQLAVKPEYASFLRQLGIEPITLPDIQQADNSPFPTIAWFRDTERTAACIQAEADLIRKFQPDRVVGTFRFTLRASTALAGVPYDSMICGCMLPEYGGGLGFAAHERGARDQAIILDSFFRYAGGALSKAYAQFNVNGVTDARQALRGERTFLWDFPEFMPLPFQAGCDYVGPISWNHWPHDESESAPLLRDNCRLAVLAFGTGAQYKGVIQRLARILIKLGFRVAVACGGQESVDRNGYDPAIVLLRYAPMNLLLKRASLLVTHGGQMTVFEALGSGVPVAVMPFQPEQAQNGVCLEQIHCGQRLIPSQVFQGDPMTYVAALDQISDDDLASRFTALVEDAEVRRHLAAMGPTMAKYGGAEALASMLETA
jgi:UDP-N-acetylglucosamine:LPS N-acetylglucosamine transferase